MPEGGKAVIAQAVFSGLKLLCPLSYVLVQGFNLLLMCHSYTIALGNLTCQSSASRKRSQTATQLPKSGISTQCRRPIRQKLRRQDLAAAPLKRSDIP